MINLLRQGLQDRQLGADLAPRHDGHQGPLRCRERFGDGVNLSRQEWPGARHFGVLRDAVGGGFGAVGGAKSVVHIDIAQSGHLARQRLVIFLFAFVDAAVFQKHHLARRHRHTIDPIGDQTHRLAEKFG